MGGVSERRMKRNFGFSHIRQTPGQDSFTVMLVGVGLAVCLTIVLWVMLVPR